MPAKDARADPNGGIGTRFSVVENEALIIDHAGTGRTKIMRDGCLTSDFLPASRRDMRGSGRTGKAETIGPLDAVIKVRTESLSTDDDAIETRVLLARFHPLADERQVLVVALVVCGPDGASLQPPPRIGAFSASASLVRKLRYLVEHAAPNPFESLRKLRSQFWSFTEFNPLEETESEA